MTLDAQPRLLRLRVPTTVPFAARWPTRFAREDRRGGAETRAEARYQLDSFERRVRDHQRGSVQTPAPAPACLAGLLQRRVRVGLDRLQTQTCYRYRRGGSALFDGWFAVIVNRYAALNPCSHPSSSDAWRDRSARLRDLTLPLSAVSR